MHDPATRARPSALRLFGSAALVTVLGLCAPMAFAGPASGAGPVVRAALAPGSINHIVVIELENEGYNTTFGSGSVATYLNGVLRKQGELLVNYYGTGHASLDNYISEVSGQSPTQSTQADCLANGAAFVDVNPGTAAPSGQVQGQGCVYPPSVPTIASQLDAKYPPNPKTHVATWKSYEEDMGNTPSRDGGVADPTGGTSCGHPAIGAPTAVVATPADQYATRHNPFVWFHSVIDNAAVCDANDVPLGTLTARGYAEPYRAPGTGLLQGQHDSSLRLHHPEPLRRRARLDVRRDQQRGHHGRGPRRRRCLPPPLGADDLEVSGIQAGWHARGRHLRRGRDLSPDGPVLCGGVL